MMRTIHILNGPNLNRLGTREPEIYGTTTLAEIEAGCHAKASELGFSIFFCQTNHEGQLVDWLHRADDEGAAAVLLNAAAYTHTSIALLDAIKAISVPVIEVHLSDPSQREPFRHRSYVGMGAVHCISGLGPASYLAALEQAAQL